jgi:hypothetical protein
MSKPTSQQQAALAWRILFERTRVRLWPREVPSHPPAPRLTPQQDWLRRLDRARDLLEQTRSVLLRRGWVSGAWFAVDDVTGVRPLTAGQASRLLHSAARPGAAPGARPGSQEAAGCLVGTMLQLVEDQDTTPSTADAWACVDELYEALHERMGHLSTPVGRVFSYDQRRSHLRALTAWNDEPGRRFEEVLDLVDRAISRTIVGACSPG